MVTSKPPFFSSTITTFRMPFTSPFSSWASAEYAPTDWSGSATTSGRRLDSSSSVPPSNVRITVAIPRFDVKSVDSNSGPNIQRPRAKRGCKSCNSLVVATPTSFSRSLINFSRRPSSFNTTSALLAVHSRISLFQVSKSSGEQAANFAQKIKSVTRVFQFC